MSADVPTWLRTILRCPVCRSPLADGVDAAGAPVLTCAGEGTTGHGPCAYRLEDGIPVLLPDEAAPLPG